MINGFHPSSVLWAVPGSETGEARVRSSNKIYVQSLNFRSETFHNLSTLLGYQILI